MTELAALLAFESDGDDRKSGKRLQELLGHLRASPYDPDDLRQFMAFAMYFARRSKAQLFQDLWALWVSGQKRGGYFVEMGAADGMRKSNTYFLETEMGWTGVVAEPNPNFTAKLRRARSCAISTKCVFSESGRTIDFLAARDGELSRIAALAPQDGHEVGRGADAETVSVETITLNDLLAEHAAPARIDFLSLDTEGSELDILLAFDFSRWDIRAIAVEHNGTAAREQLYELLTGKGYRRQWSGLSRFDDWYIKTC